MKDNIFYFHTSPVAGRRNVSKRKVRATIAGVLNNGIMYFGIAKCDHEDKNKFDKKLGRELALKRATMKDAELKLPVPADMDEKYIANWFVKNAIKYVTSKYSVVINKK